MVCLDGSYRAWQQESRASAIGGEGKTTGQKTPAAVRGSRAVHRSVTRRLL
jgi:hypothetical protein